MLCAISFFYIQRFHTVFAISKFQQISFAPRPQTGIIANAYEGLNELVMIFMGQKNRLWYKKNAERRKKQSTTSTSDSNTYICHSDELHTSSSY